MLGLQGTQNQWVTCIKVSTRWQSKLQRISTLPVKPNSPGQTNKESQEYIESDFWLTATPDVLYFLFFAEYTWCTVKSK